MERKNTILLTVIAVATLLVAVVGATFAYFIASNDVTATSTMNITTSSVDSIASTATPCGLTVTAADMAVAAGTPTGADITVGSGQECTLTISATKQSDAATTTCTYDVVYTPNTTSPFVVVGKSAENTTNKIEASLQGSAAATTGGTSTLPSATTVNGDNPYNLLAADAKGFNLYNVSAATTIVKGATFSFTATSSVTWTFTPHFYNYNFDQSDMANKQHQGVLSIANYHCDAA